MLHALYLECQFIQKVGSWCRKNFFLSDPMMTNYLLLLTAGWRQYTTKISDTYMYLFALFNKKKTLIARYWSSNIAGCVIWWFAALATVPLQVLFVPHRNLNLIILLMMIKFDKHMPESYDVTQEPDCTTVLGVYRVCFSLPKIYWNCF